MRLESNAKVSRLAKYAIFVYIMISLFYTTNHYFSVHHVNTPTVNTFDQLNTRYNNRREDIAQIIVEDHPTQAIQQTTNDQIIWPGSKGKE